MYLTDFTTRILLQTPNDADPTVDAVFSVYAATHDGDSPDLKLETIRLGSLHMPRADVLAWCGAAEVERLETAAAKEWKPYETDERSDQWAAQ